MILLRHEMEQTKNPEIFQFNECSEQIKFTRKKFNRFNDFCGMNKRLHLCRLQAVFMVYTSDCKIVYIIDKSKFETIAKV